MEIILIIMIALIASLNLARFTRSEPPNAPIHWLKISLGDARSLNIHHVLIGTAIDFSEVLKLAVPRNMIENRPNSIVAKIMLEDKITTPNGNQVDEILMLQSSAVNDLLGILEGREKARKKVKKWVCEEVNQFDSWTCSDNDSSMEISVAHLPLNSAGSRSAYEVLEVDE